MSHYSISLNEMSDVLDEMNQGDTPDHHASVLLLTCIDFRFFDEVEDVIRAKGLVGDYDHVIVAGAELGPVIDFGPEPKPHWRDFFLDHLKLSKSLHNISKVLVLGHEDCGAYKKFVGQIDPQDEESVHLKYAEKLKALINEQGLSLEFEAHMLRSVRDVRAESRQKASSGEKSV